MSELTTPHFLKQDLNAKSLSYYVTDTTAYIDQDLIDWLKLRSQEAGNKNARICLHQSPEALFHQMIIVEYSSNYYRPHKHLYKEESCHLVEGEALFLVFDDSGKIKTSQHLSDKKGLLFRVGINQWHTVIPVTPFSVYHESKPGPFLSAADRLFPSWAPQREDKEEAMLYQKHLLASCEVSR